METQRHPIADALREAALAYPETREDHPWGESAFKVRDKVFLFMDAGEDGGFGISVKLPDTHMAALMFDFAEPTGYGLGKSGWISARFAEEDDPPLGLLLAWLDESYRAIAPKKLVKTLSGTR